MNRGEKSGRANTETPRCIICAVVPKKSAMRIGGIDMVKVTHYRAFKHAFACKDGLVRTLQFQSFIQETAEGRIMYLKAGFEEMPIESEILPEPLPPDMFKTEQLQIARLLGNELGKVDRDKKWQDFIRQDGLAVAIVLPDTGNTFSL